MKFAVSSFEIKFLINEFLFEYVEYLNVCFDKTNID